MRILQGRQRFLRHTLWSVISLLLSVLVVVGCIVAYAQIGLPNVETLKAVHMQIPLRVYTSDHHLIAEYGKIRRIPTPLSQIPQSLINAVLATEDQRFYENSGVDLKGLVRAAWVVFTTGHKTQGASTITMQVARNFFLTDRKTYTRKIKEILLALKLGRDFSKDQILSLYLNKIFFGHHAYGVAAAAEVYYGKALVDLSLPQMAMLAGLPQAPSANNPITNPAAALKRRNHVLGRMLALQKITQADYQAAIDAPITARYHHEQVAVKAPYVGDIVQRQMYQRYGERVYSSGYTVVTTVSSTLQAAANKAVEQGLLAYDTRHGYHDTGENLGSLTEDSRAVWMRHLQVIQPLYGRLPAAVVSVDDRSATVLLADARSVVIPWSGLSWARIQNTDGSWGAYPLKASEVVSEGDRIWVMQKPDHTWRLASVPDVQAALVALDPSTGAVLALVGGSDYQRSRFDRATQARRQPGSNIKPFIYSAALSTGKTLATVINDAPIVIKGKGEDQYWRPHNDNRVFAGPTLLANGLIKSRNLVSIRILKSIGVDYAVSYLQRFGFSAKDLPNGLSLALGSAQFTPMQIARAYATFANGGDLVTPTIIRAVYNDENLKITAMTVTKQPGITPQNSFLITKALQAAVQHGTGWRARALKRTDVAGKTGTTNDQKDAWFSGYNADVVCTVWVGYDDTRSLFEYGSRAAVPIWNHFMRTALKGKPLHTLPAPPGIVSVRIDPATGLLARPNDPHAVFQYFRQDHVPTQYAETRPEATEAASPDASTSAEDEAAAPIW